MCVLASTGPRPRSAEPAEATARELAAPLQAKWRMIEREPLSDARIAELILLGDCACAFGDTAALERVCRTVTARGGDVADRALAVCRWACRDLAVATAFWEELAAALRKERAPERAPRLRVPPRGSATARPE